jgi:membrane protein YdbS with pleckstrin-like domain
MAKSFQETKYLRTLESLDNDEQILCDVRQHPFGIIAVYVMCIFGLLVGFLIITAFIPETFGSTGKTYSVLALLWVIISFFLSAAMIVATFVYKQSRLTVTSKNVVLVLQGGVFTRKVSQISLANVEDVSSEQIGVLAQLFGFGRVTVETAGEQANFIFNYAPQPARVSRIILNAKSDFMKQTGQTGPARNITRRG